MLWLKVVKVQGGNGSQRLSCSGWGSRLRAKGAGLWGIDLFRRWPVAGGRWPVSGVRCPPTVTGVRWSGVQCPVDGVRWPVVWPRFVV